MKIYLIILSLISNYLIGQNHELNLHMQSGMASAGFSNFYMLGLGYYGRVYGRFSLGLGGEVPLIINKSNYSHIESNTIKTLNFNYTERMRVLNLDFLIKTRVIRKENYSLNVITGITLQNYKAKYIPLLEILDYEIINKSESIIHKNFLLPKLSINFDWRLNKSFYILAMIHLRTGFFSESRIIYTTRSVSRTTGTSDPGSSYGNVFVEEQLGFNLGVSYRF